MNFLYMLGIVLTCFSVFILQSFAADSSSATEESSSILQKGYTFNLTFQLDYLLFLPKSYGHAPVQKWPLIIFLHGAGERGDNLDLVKKHGIPKVVGKNPDFPFITVSPQCPKDSW